MTPEHHRRVSELFAAARRLSEGERAQFLVDACAGDENLRRDVEPLLRACLALHKTLYGSDDWRTAHVESKLGACLGRLNKDDEAVQLLTSSYEELAANDDSPLKNRQSALDRLVAYYNDRHMPEASARYAALRKQAEDKANRASAQVPSHD